MQWSDLKDTVASVAPILGSFLAGPGGQLFGSIVANALGVDETPEAVADAMKNHADAKLALETLEKTHQQTLLSLKVKMAEYVIDANTRAQEQVNLTMRAELAAEHWFYKSWRPFFGFVMSLAFGSTMLMPVVLIWFHPERLALFTQFLTASVVVWSVGFGVLGVYVHKRSQDKLMKAGLMPGSFVESFKAQARRINNG